MRAILASIATAALAFGVLSTAGIAGEANEGCIDSHDIDQSSVINHTTIVLKMRSPSKGYRRLDLNKNCTIDKATGFRFDTSINKLCTSTVLKLVDGPASPMCTIDRIVSIDRQMVDALYREN